MASNVLSLRSVGLRLGAHTLFSGLSAELPPGQMLGIAGESGSGKTSLLRAILGFVPLTEGEIEVGGIHMDAAHVDEVRRLTAYVPQELQPLAATGHDLVALTHSLRANRNSAPTHEALATTLAALGLEPKMLDQQASKLSGGQRQRIIIAAALTLPKPLILLDEPTAPLDHDTARITIDTLRATLVSQRRAAVVVSHSRSVLEACDITLTIKS